VGDQKGKIFRKRKKRSAVDYLLFYKWL